MLFIAKQVSLTDPWKPKQAQISLSYLFQMPGQKSNKQSERKEELISDIITMSRCDAQTEGNYS